MTDARYRFAADKAFAAIHWMVSERQHLDLHAALKACYFADKSHLNEFLQPIFGARYRAMKYGPVPLEIYEMMKGDGIWLWEVKADATPWKITNYTLALASNVVPDISALSESEFEHLAAALERSCKMTFTERTASTHGPDWREANGGIMRYEDMIDPRDDIEDVHRFMKENAPYLRL